MNVPREVQVHSGNIKEALTFKVYIFSKSIEIANGYSLPKKNNIQENYNSPKTPTHLYS